MAKKKKEFDKGRVLQEFLDAHFAYEKAKNGFREMAEQDDIHEYTAHNGGKAYKVKFFQHSESYYVHEIELVKLPDKGE